MLTPTSIDGMKMARMAFQTLDEDFFDIPKKQLGPSKKKGFDS